MTARRTYTDDERATAREAYEAEGMAAAVRATGIPRGTLSAWARKETWAPAATAAAEKARERTAAGREALVLRKQATVERMLTEINGFLDELHTAKVEQKVVVVSMGKDAPTRPEIVEVYRSTPTTREIRDLVWAAAVLWDKVQAASGGVTERVVVEDGRDVQEAAAEILRLVPTVGQQLGA